MTAAEIQTLINAAKSSEADLVTWTELRAILEGLKNQEGAEGDYTLDMLGDVDVDGFLDDAQVLRWNGTSWVNEVLTTDEISEGDNLFFTLGRSRNAISAGTGIHYNPATGVITSTITQYTSAMARAAISLTTSGSGAASYDNTTGELNIPTPTSVNIYNDNGTLTGNRTVTMGGNTLTFTGGSILHNAPNGNLVRFNAIPQVGLNTATTDLAYDVNTSGGSGTNYIRAVLTVINNLNRLELSNRFGIFQRSGNNSQGWRISDGGVDSRLFTIENLNASNGAIAINNNAARVVTISTANNFLVNTATDAGFRLDVNGTLRTSGIIHAGTFTAGAGLQATDFIATTGRVRAAGGISFRSPIVGDNALIGVFPDGSSGQSGVDIFSASNRVFNFSWVGNLAGTAYNITQSYTTEVTTGNVITLNLSPTIQPTVANTVVYTGILYNPTVANLNGGTHRAIHTVTGDVLLATTSGRVGVGTTAPQYVFDVATPVSTSAAVRTTYSGGAASANISVIGKTDASADIWGGLEAVGGQETSVRLRSVTNHPVTFWVSTIERMRLFTTGNFGINTTTDAGFRLDVNGTARVQNTLRIVGTSGYTADLVQFFMSGGGVTGGKINAFGQWFITNGDTNPVVAFVGNNVLRLGQTTAAAAIAFNNSANIIGQWAGTAGTFSNSANAQTITIINNENTANTFGFTFAGDMTAGQLGSKNLISLKHWGTSGVLKFSDIAASQTYTLINVDIEVSPTQTGKVLRGYYWNPTLSGTALTSNLPIHTVTGDVLFGTTSGNVGIGTTSPTAKLHVVGNASISDDFFATIGTGKRAVFGATGDNDYRVSIDGDLRVFGKIRTAAPDNGSGPGIWKLGSSATGTFTLNTSQCLEVELNGTFYRIATLNPA